MGRTRTFPPLDLSVRGRKSKSLASGHASTSGVERTRRSARQQERQSRGAIKQEDDDFEYLPPAGRKKQSCPQHPKSKTREEGTSGSAAAAIRRLVTPSTMSKGRMMNGKGRALHKHGKERRPGLLSQPMALPLKVEIDEGTNPVNQGPRKRGRKRRSDVMAQLAAAEFASGSVQGPENTQQYRKRGRQSAATAGVKPRFPFCCICLSREAPSDYVINYLSSPNEYQRMKRLFSYVYKDLKLPFTPFDLERENVFDYCDLPLCNACIVLYQDMYHTYAQIEDARDSLKNKMETMVRVMQHSEQNPATFQQSSLIRNTQDSLMQKYANFRKKFLSHQSGDTRIENAGLSCIPATISRVTVISQVPKRDTACQTFLTAANISGQKVPTSPQKPTPASVNPSTASASSSKVSTATASSSGTSAATPSAPNHNQKASSTPTVLAKVVVKVEPGSKITPATASASDKPSSTASSSSDKLPTTNISVASTSKNAASIPQKTGTPSKVPSTSTSHAIKTPIVQSPIPKPPTSRPPGSSVITIIKTPGGQGPAIIRKLPVSKPSSYFIPAAAIAAAAIKKGQKSTTPTVSTSTSLQAGKGTESKKETSSSLEKAKVKDEPVDEAGDVEEDPFLKLSNVRSMNKSSSPQPGTSKSVQGGKAKDTDKAEDTNVFRKHKKLMVTSTSGQQEQDKSTSNEEEGDDDSTPRTEVLAEDPKEQLPQNDSDSENET